MRVASMGRVVRACVASTRTMSWDRHASVSVGSSVVCRGAGYH